MKMLLLISALALLANARVLNHNNNLNSIIDLIEKYDESLSKEVFVDDVSHLAEGSGKCREKFFCKAYAILLQHKHEEVDRIVENLKIYKKMKDFKCEEALKGVNSTGVKIQLPKLLEHLKSCSRHTNIIGASTISK